MTTKSKYTDCEDLTNHMFEEKDRQNSCKDTDLPEEEWCDTCKSSLRVSNPNELVVPNKETKELSQTCCRLIAGLIRDVKDTSFTLEETDTHFIHRIELHLKKRGDGK